TVSDVRRDVLEGSGRQVVDDVNLVALIDQAIGEMASDEPGSTCDEVLHCQALAVPVTPRRAKRYENAACLAFPGLHVVFLCHGQRCTARAWLCRNEDHGQSGGGLAVERAL